MDKEAAQAYMSKLLDSSEASAFLPMLFKLVHSPKTPPPLRVSAIILCDASHYKPQHKLYLWLVLFPRNSLIRTVIG